MTKNTTARPVREPDVPTRSKATRGFSRPFKAVAAAAVFFAISVSSLLGPVAPASAATTSGYPTALVQFMASTRTLPYIESNTYWGYALHNPGATSGNQVVSVACWYDGDWATGNYYTNRWFKVLVYESYDGYGTPRWLFVHASYVYNQPNVRECYATGSGIW